MISVLVVVLSIGVACNATKNVDSCKKNTIEVFTNHPESCKKVTADCLAAFDVKGITKTCLEALKEKTIEELQAKTANEILESEVSQIPENEGLLKALVTKNSLNQFPEKFISSAVKSKSHMKILMDLFKANPEAVGKFFTEEAFKDILASTCKKFDAKLIEAIPENTFAALTSDCLKAMEPEAFKGLDGAKFSKIPPKTLEDITASQASQVKTKAASKLTPKQAKHLGEAPDVPAATKNWMGKKASLKVRQEYIKSHPCDSAKKWQEKLTSIEAKSKLKSHCRRVWNRASGSFNAPSIGTILSFCVGFTVFYLVL